jgi:hypothetical protein
MHVTWFVSYLCNRSLGNQTDRDAMNFIRAIKGDDVTGSLRRLDTKDATGASEWFGEVGALVLARRRLPPPIVLIPVPSSGSTLAGGKNTCTVQLAQSIASHLGKSVVCDGLRWRRALKSSHTGGIRDPQYLYDNLSLIVPPPKGTCVVVDDLLTTGGHILASAARVSSVTNQCRMALCVGRSVSQPRDNRFSFVEEELRDFVPTDRVQRHLSAGCPTHRALCDVWVLSPPPCKPITPKLDQQPLLFPRDQGTHPLLRHSAPALHHLQLLPPPAPAAYPLASQSLSQNPRTSPP